MNKLCVLKVYTFSVVFGLLFIVELIINQFTHSLVILSDCYFNMFIWMNLIISIISFRMSGSISLRATFGWARIEVLGALFNIIFTLALCFSVFVEAVLNFIHASHHQSENINPYILLVPGLISLFSNLWRAASFGESYGPKNVHLSIRGEEVQVNCVVYGDSSEQSDDKTAKPLLDINKINELPYPKVNQKKKEACTGMTCLIFKAIGTASLLFGSSLSLFYVPFHVYEIIDPLSGLVGVLIILSVIYPSLKESGLILLQTVPKHIEVSQMEKAMYKEFPNIIQIHDLHIWCLTEDKVIVTCHLDLPPLSTHLYKELSEKIEYFFARQGVSSVTVQPEFRQSLAEKVEKQCLYTCSKEEVKCETMTCCHNDNLKKENPA